jgi:anti-sigma factor RsiW
MSDGAAITCREMVELVTDYLEDAMDADRRARFEEHLSACDGCTRYVDQMRETIRLAGLLPEERIPAEGRDALLGAFRGWRG